MLPKVMYGLKKAPISWNKKRDNFLRETKFIKFTIKNGVYFRISGSDFLILCLYVDDLLITDNCKKKIEDLKNDLIKEFKFFDLVNI